MSAYVGVWGYMLICVLPEGPATGRAGPLFFPCRKPLYMHLFNRDNDHGLIGYLTKDPNVFSAHFYPALRSIRLLDLYPISLLPKPLQIVYLNARLHYCLASSSIDFIVLKTFFPFLDSRIL